MPVFDASLLSYSLNTSAILNLDVLRLYLLIINIYSKRSPFSKMLNPKDKSRIPKKVNQTIAKFSYYVNTLLPELFGYKQSIFTDETSSTKPLNSLKIKQGPRNMIYNYYYSHCQNSALIDANSILDSVKKLYLQKDVIKINELSFSREKVIKRSFLPIYGVFSQIIDFVLIPVQKENPVQHHEKTHVKAKTNQTVSHFSGYGQQSKTSKNLNHSSFHAKPDQYDLYVIHNCGVIDSQIKDQNNIKWEHFVQRYHFKNLKKHLNSQEKGTIHYQMACSYNSTKGYFQFGDKLMQEFIQSHLKTIQNNLQSLQKLQGYLLLRSSQVENTKRQKQDIAFSEQHKRQNKIPIEYYKHYTVLKKEIYKFYASKNQIEISQINHYMLDNMICRYLIARQYNFKDAKESLQKYIVWEHEITTKYPSIQCFKELHERDMYMYLGQDHMGRAVIYNRAAEVKFSEIKDVQKYNDYYSYFIEIYVKSKMRGYADQMIVIGDLQNLSSDNLKLEVTKRNLHDSMNYGAQRQYSLIIINASQFAQIFWNGILKGLMPKKTIQKINIVGSNKSKILSVLEHHMDVSIIPEVYGGKNSNYSNKKQKGQSTSKKYQGKAEHTEQQKSFKHTYKTVKKSKTHQIAIDQEFNEFQMIDPNQMKETGSKSRVSLQRAQSSIFDFFNDIRNSIGQSLAPQKSSK